MPSGKHAIVTGGSSGIGKATAKVLLDRGWCVSILALDDPMLAETYQQLVQDAPGRVHFGGVDLIDPDATHGAIENCISAFGPVDALVTCAGIAKPARFADLSAQDFTSQMDVNYLGTLNAVRAVYPDMKACGSGRIGVISSGAGLLGIYGHTAYAPTKFAVRGLAEALRMEATPHGVTVTTCYLPDTDTPQLRANAAIRPAETSAISGTSHPWDAAEIGRRIVDGMERGAAHVSPGWQIGMIRRLASPLAPLLRWHVDRIVRHCAANGVTP